MTDAFVPIDHGPRSNESDFGALDESPNSRQWRKAPLWRTPVSSGEVAGEWLPFTIGIASSEAMLARVQALRQTAYGHHLPDLAAKFGRADPMDRLQSMSVFYAEDKDTGRLIGSARLQTNLFGPLQIEGSLELPDERKGQLLSEVTRLAVLPGCPYPVRLSLVKAIHLFCIANQIGGIVVGSRRSLLRQYLNLGFACLYGDNRMVPLAHGSGLEHRILFRDTVTSEAESRMRQHPDHTFVFRTYHPDIQVFQPVLEQSFRGLGGVPAAVDYNSKAA
jgi:hypothetical protein